MTPHIYVIVIIQGLAIVFLSLAVFSLIRAVERIKSYLFDDDNDYESFETTLTSLGYRRNEDGEIVLDEAETP